MVSDAWTGGQAGRHGVHVMCVQWLCELSAFMRSVCVCVCFVASRVCHLCVVGVALRCIARGLVNARAVTNGGAQQWRSFTGKELAVKPLLSPDAQLLIVSTDDVLRGIDAASGATLWERVGDLDASRGLAWSANNPGMVMYVFLRWNHTHAHSVGVGPPHAVYYCRGEAGWRRAWRAQNGLSMRVCECE